LFVSTLFSPTARAEIVTFNLNSTLSQLNLTGNAVVTGAGNFLFATQASGSLSTRFSGSITADLNSFLNPTSITFQSANIVGLNSGVWIPDDNGVPFVGNPPAGFAANYGIEATFGVGAIRGLTFNLGSTGAQAIVGGSFANASQQWNHSGGKFDLRAFQIDAGGTSNLTAIGNNLVANTNATSGIISVANGIATMTLPVQISIPYSVPGTPAVAGTFIYTGTLTATAVPEPSSIALIAMCGISYIGTRLRNRKIEK